MKNYYPERMELGPRDVVARATFNEIVAGRGTPTRWSLVRCNPSLKGKNFGQTPNDVRTIQKY